MDYDDLKKIAEEICIEADNQNILSGLYWYSPESRKLKPASKIGYYEREPQRIRFKYGCKLIMVFPRLAFDNLAQIINRYIPQNKQIAYREDYKSKDEFGFDVYQRVDELQLFIEPNCKSSDKFTVEGMKKNGKYWAECQEQALKDVEPPLSIRQQLDILAEVKVQFKKALAYLEAKKDPKAELRVRRLSGVRHRMVRVDLADDQSKKSGFSDLVLVFGSSSKHLPLVTLPKPPKPERKPRSDSIAAQYKADPTSFKYYDQFGIFEVYDK